jgi:hypothetical protein
MLLAACETPTLTIRFRLTEGESQQCISENDGNPTTECSDITLQCDSYLSIRIVPPNLPNVPFVFECKPLPMTGQRKLCGIAGVPVPQPMKPIPEQVLEVQMAVFPATAVDFDDSGNPVCPIVQFGVNGLPVMDIDCSAGASSPECRSRPAIGGRAFYHPGDEETVIDLGCTEVELVSGEQCKGTNHTDVIATVNDFENAGVDVATASSLTVSIGEPIPGNMDNYRLELSDTHPLERLPVVLPTWSGNFIDLGLTATYCIDVRENVPLATNTLTCRKLDAPDPKNLSALGTRLKPELLATILTAAQLSFPSKGLVVGIVLNEFYQPVANAKVICDPAPCTIKYLSQDKLSFTTGTMTSSNGIWISQDAPYGSIFSRPFPSVVSSLGGLVDNKVTIVVLQEPATGGM